MILIFLGSLRATLAVFFSIPLSVLATFMVLQFDGSSSKQHGAGWAGAGAFAPHRQLRCGAGKHLPAFGDWRAAVVAAENGGREVALPVLASTLTTAIVFFPVTLLSGVSKFLFSAMALAVVVALFASYVIAMTVVPLYCSKYLKLNHPEALTSRMRVRRAPWKAGRAASRRDSTRPSIRASRRCWRPTRSWCSECSGSRRRCWSSCVVFVVSLGLYWLLGFSYFPQTDAGQFVINIKAPSGTKLLVTEQEVAKAEALIKEVVRPVGSGHHCRQHRRRQWIFCHLYPECSHAYRLHPGRANSGTQHRELRIYRPHQAASGCRKCRS